MTNEQAKTLLDELNAVTDQISGIHAYLDMCLVYAANGKYSETMEKLNLIKKDLKNIANTIDNKTKR